MGSSRTRDRTCLSCIGRRVFTTEPPGKSLSLVNILIFAHGGLLCTHFCVNCYLDLGCSPTFCTQGEAFTHGQLTSPWFWPSADPRHPVAACCLKAWCLFPKDPSGLYQLKQCVRKTPGPQSSCLGPQDLMAGRVLFSNTHFYSQRPLQGDLKFVGLEGAGRTWTVSSETFNLLIGLGRPRWLLMSALVVSGLLEKRVGRGEGKCCLGRSGWVEVGGGAALTARSGPTLLTKTFLSSASSTRRDSPSPISCLFRQLCPTA